MLAIERSERASITTGKDVPKNVAEGDPLDGYGYWRGCCKSLELWCPRTGEVGDLNKADGLDLN